MIHVVMKNVWEVPYTVNTKYSNTLPTKCVYHLFITAMGTFLSIKASLLEPKLIEHSWNLHTATTRLLVQYATTDNCDKLATPKLPLPEEVPPCLACIPEFLAENLTEYLQFLRRFSEQSFEDGRESLTHVMTFIIVFMGSKQRMNNPHLRAKLAEVLEGIMPRKDQPMGRSLVST